MVVHNSHSVLAMVLLQSWVHHFLEESHDFAKVAKLGEMLHVSSSNTAVKVLQYFCKCFLCLACCQLLQESARWWMLVALALMIAVLG